MSTTALFVELLVCGTQVAIWILLLVMSMLDLSDLTVLSKPVSTAVGAIAVVGVYSLGVVFDRVWDSCLRRVDKHIRRQHFMDQRELAAARKAVFSSGTGLSPYVDYIRTRMRIARATFCNSFLITCAALWLIESKTGEVWTRSYSLTFIAGVLLTSVAFFAFKTLDKSYYKTLKSFGSRSEEILKPNNCADDSSWEI
jgi:hypothetical protein